MKSHGPQHVVYVLSQQTGGPVDLTVGLAIELAGRTGGPKITVVGPEPITSAGDLGELWHPFLLPNKFDVQSGRKLRRELATLTPDVVHAQDRRSGLMTTWIPKAVQVLTYHGVPERVPAAWASGKGGPKPGLRDRAVLTSDALLARTAARVYAPSSAMGTMLVEQLHIPKRKVEVLPNGVQLPVARPPLTEVGTIVFVGALIPRKAVNVALAGFAKAHKAFPHLRFRIVGDGEDRAALERQAQDLAVAEVTDFVGYRSDVPVQLSSADVFVLPSLNENQPLALLEAMGTGLACIATDVGGTAEVMPEGCGLLVKPGDSDGIASALESLARDPVAAAEMAGSAALRAREEYSVAACADRHLAAYGRLLGGLGR
jgi:glycosyltransferase involved in cell wall biosynthesis